MPLYLYIHLSVYLSIYLITQGGVWINELPKPKEVIFELGKQSTSTNIIKDMWTVENIKELNIDCNKLYVC